MTLNLKTRIDESGVYGVVESYKVYNYKGKGYVEIIAGVQLDKECFTTPYIYRKGHFESLEDRVLEENEGEKWVDKYIKAKDPFYTILNEGYIEKIRVGVDWVNGIIDTESIEISMYSLSADLMSKYEIAPYKELKGLGKGFFLKNHNIIRTIGLCISKESENNMMLFDKSKFLKSRLNVY